MYGWMDLELARQHREELLREAHERRMSRTSFGRTPSRELTTSVRRLVRFMRPERSGGLVAAETPGTPIQGCSAD